MIASFPLALFPGGVVVDVPGAGDLLEIRAVAEEVFAFRSLANRDGDDRDGGASGVVALTERGLLLIDTGGSEAPTEALLAWGAARFRRPWIGAVITRDGGDRLTALRRAGVPIAVVGGGNANK